MPVTYTYTIGVDMQQDYFPPYSSRYLYSSFSLPQREISVDAGAFCCSRPIYSTTSPSFQVRSDRQHSDITSAARQRYSSPRDSRTECTGQQNCHYCQYRPESAVYDATVRSSRRQSFSNDTFAFDGSRNRARRPSERRASSATSTQNVWRTVPMPELFPPPVLRLFNRASMPGINYLDEEHDPISIGRFVSNWITDFKPDGRIAWQESYIGRNLYLYQGDIIRLRTDLHFVFASVTEQLWNAAEHLWQRLFAWLYHLHEKVAKFYRGSISDMSRFVGAIFCECRMETAELARELQNWQILFNSHVPESRQ